jgi:predicted dehydrogenase
MTDVPSLLLVGAGSMGRMWGELISGHPGATLGGWVDVVPGRAEQAAAELGIDGVRCWDNLAAALAAGADAVVCVTTPETHAQVAIPALQAGLPVLSEKPLAGSLVDAHRMIDAADAAGRLLMVSQSRRYEPWASAFRALLNGPLGTCGMLACQMFLGPRFGGFRDTMESPLLLDMAIHTFDYARYACARDAVAVYCEEFNPPWSWFQGDASANAQFEMEGEVRFSYTGSWCAEGLPTSWNGAWRATCAEGTATWDGDHAPLAERVVPELKWMRDVTPQPIPDDVQDPPATIAGSLREFLAALDGGPTPMGECHDNIQSLAMVFAALESSRRRERVTIAEVMQSTGASAR